MTTIVKEARYILTSIENNNNKFWNISLFENGSCETHWGRVGEAGQRKIAPGGGDHFFESKCREKSGKGYQPQKTLNNGVGGAKTLEAEKLAEIAHEQIETDNAETLALVSYLAQVNIHNILQATSLHYDTSRGTFSTPLGIVTLDGLNEARRLLTAIGGYINAQNWDDSGLIKTLNDYLMLIPQNIGRGRPDAKRLYPDLEAVRSQNNILDSLEASLQTVLDARKDEEADDTPAPKLFEARLTRLTDLWEIERIRAKYRQTQQGMHACAHLDVKRVFRVEIGAMHREFEAQGRAIGNIKELWHGTKAANLLSILKTGFFIPPAGAPYVTGRMFGNGVYFSDQSTKSLNYAYGYWDGKREDNCFMFLANVAMGREYTPPGPRSGLPLDGYDSTFAQAGQSGVANNEMIVYKTCQIDPCYLVEFAPKGS